MICQACISRGVVRLADVRIRLGGVSLRLCWACRDELARALDETETNETKEGVKQCTKVNATS